MRIKLVWNEYEKTRLLKNSDIYTHINDKYIRH